MPNSARQDSEDSVLRLLCLQDCHVLTFSSSGSVSDHLVLHPQLATGNFIIKAVWLPGSQTELAIVTADFVKVWLGSRGGGWWFSWKVRGEGGGRGPG